MASVPDEAIDKSAEVTHGAFKLYVCLCRHRNNQKDSSDFGLAWPGRSLVSEKTGLNLTYISDAKKELISKGWIDADGPKVRLLKGFSDGANSRNNRLQQSDKPTDTDVNESVIPTIPSDEESQIVGITDSTVGITDSDSRNNRLQQSDKPTPYRTKQLNQAIEPVKEPVEELRKKTAQPKSTKSKTACVLPEGFRPKSLPPKLKEGFTTPEIAEQFEHFKDYHERNGSEFKSWDAAWRMWMRKAPEFRRNRNGPTAKPDRDVWIDEPEIQPMTPEQYRADFLNDAKMLGWSDEFTELQWEIDQSGAAPKGPPITPKPWPTRIAAEECRREVQG